jgi:hypothetical protein
MMILLVGGARFELATNGLKVRAAPLYIKALEQAFFLCG